MSRVLDGEMVAALLALLPEAERTRLALLALDEGASEAELEAALEAALEAVDWEGQREAIRALIGRIMPLDELVPEIYAAWRPVIRDAVTFTGSRLSPARLLPKLLEQMLLPDEMPLEQRLLILVAQMPSLQKIGQIVARNPNLDPAFRAELTRLENAIEDITPEAVRAEIHRQLGRHLRTYRVEIQEVILAEASVSAVVRFTWWNPVSREREPAVFKVLKPYVIENFPEEMAILQDLADFFDAHRRDYELPQVGFREVMDDVRRLLEREIDLPTEQKNLRLAHERYRHVPGVRTPRLIRELSTPTITAMSEEEGVKVTQAYPESPRRRRRLAARIIEALIAVPLFAPEEHAIFHADPHAGNLFADESTGELILLDWALTERLSREQRRQTVLLTLAVALRDEARVFEAISILAEDDLAADGALAAMVRGQIARFFETLSPLTIPGFAQVMTLLDGMAFGGLRFPAELLMFRKVLFTLEGVLNDVDPDAQIDPILGRYALGLLQREAPARLLRPLTDPRATFRSHLSNFDLTALVLSLPLLGGRIWLQGAERLTERGLDELQRLLERLLPGAASDEPVR